MAYSPLAIANEFIALAQKEGSGLEHMKLQKLVHFVHGYSLVDGESVVNENPQVWRYGPVFPSLYQDLKYHGSEPITAQEGENYFGPVPVVEKDDVRVRELIQKVWRKYSRYTGFQLSDLTHKKGTPWYQMVEKLDGIIPNGLDIPADIVRDHYRSLPALG